MKIHIMQINIADFYGDVSTRCEWILIGDFFFLRLGLDLNVAKNKSACQIINNKSKLSIVFETWLINSHWQNKLLKIKNNKLWFY